MFYFRVRGEDMETDISTLAVAIVDDDVSASASLWDDIEPTAEEWGRVKEVVDTGSCDVEARLDAVMEELKVGLPVQLLRELDEAVGDYVRLETEAAFALGLAVGRREQSPDAWIEKFERMAEERGVRIGKKGRPRRGENVTTMEQLALELGVSVDGKEENQTGEKE